MKGWLVFFPGSSLFYDISLFKVPIQSKMKIVPCFGEREIVVMNCGGKSKISYQCEWNRKAENLGEAAFFVVY